MNRLLDAALTWRLRPPFYYGWLILAMSFLATFAASGVTMVVLGGIQVFISEDTGWSKSTIALAVSVGTWVSGLVAPLAGRLADRYGPRWLMPAGMVVAGVSFFSLAGVNAVWQFYAAYILGRAVSNPVLYGVVPRTAAVNFFRRKRNMALALISMFRPISGAITIQIISFIAIHRGWQAAYRYLGVLSCILLLPLILVMRRRPEDIGLLPDGARSEASVARPLTGGRAQGREPAAATEREAEFSWTAGEALRTRTFWLIAAAAALGTLATSALGFSLVPYLYEDAGISKVQAVGVLSFGTFLAVANLGWGYLADRFTPRRCLMVAMAAAAVLTFYLLTVSSLAAAYSFALLWGVFSGTVGSLENMMLAQYFGRNSFGTILGIFSPVQTAALGLGPVLQAAYRDLTGSYTSMYLTLLGVYLVATVLIFLARPPALPERAGSGAEAGVE